MIAFLCNLWLQFYTNHTCNKNTYMKMNDGYTSLRVHSLFSYFSIQNFVVVPVPLHFPPPRKSAKCKQYFMHWKGFTANLNLFSRAIFLMPKIIFRHKLKLNDEPLSMTVIHFYQSGFYSCSPDCCAMALGFFRLLQNEKILHSFFLSAEYCDMIFWLVKNIHIYSYHNLSRKRI